jgi:hypothetical protein
MTAPAHADSDPEALPVRTPANRQATVWAASLVLITLLATGIAIWRMRLPAPTGPLAMPTDPLPWGNPAPETWDAALMAANTAHRGLTWAWAQTGVHRAAVAFPMALRQEKGHDGLDRAYWTEWRPPVLATWLQQDSGTSVWIRLDRAVVFHHLRVEVRWRGSTGRHHAVLPAVPTPDGDCLAQWHPPSDTPTEELTLLVRPEGWQEWFPIVLRPAVWPLSQTSAALVPSGPGGRPAALPPLRRVGNSVLMVSPISGDAPRVALTVFKAPLQGTDLLTGSISYGLTDVVHAQRVGSRELAGWWPFAGQPVWQSWFSLGPPDPAVREAVRPYHPGDSLPPAR